MQETTTTLALVSPLYECSLCDYMGDSKSQLAKHMGDVHGKHPCDQCGKKFWLKTELNTHRMVVHVTKCDQCEAKFGQETDLQTHIKEVHEVTESLLIPEQDFSDSTEISLEETSEKSAQEVIDETDVTEDIMEKPKCDICCKEENSQL